ncbi:hypothetical protein ABK040_000839 [Willaertia magna]
MLTTEKELSGERNIKKRKVEYFLSQDELYEIILFIDNLKDFISLSKVNKYFYNTLFIKQNEILNYIIKQFKICIELNNKLPNYLFKINYLRVSRYNINLLNKFKNLKYLEISNLYFSPTIKKHEYIFPKFEKLIELKLHNCELPVDNIPFLSNLQKLELNNSSIGVNKITNLESFINLTELQIVNSNIVENSLQNLKNLEKLELIFRDVLQYDVDFSNLKNLKNLNIQGIINNFNKLPNLEELTCCLKNISNFNNLKHIKRLKITNLKKTKAITDKDLMELPNIVELDLHYNKDINGECLLKLTNLEKLNISYTKIADEHLINLQKLKYLKASHCHYFTGECLLKLVNLEYLDIYSNKKVKDGHFKNLKKLTYLHLKRCTGISGKCFKYLPALQEIEGTEESGIEAKFLQKLKNRIPCVKITSNPFFNK